MENRSSRKTSRSHKNSLDAGEKTRVLKIDLHLEKRQDPLIHRKDHDGGLLACQEHAGRLEEQAKLKVIPGYWETCGEKPPSAEERSDRTQASMLAERRYEGFSRTSVTNTHAYTH